MENKLMRIATSAVVMVLCCMCGGIALWAVVDDSHTWSFRVIVAVAVLTPAFIAAVVVLPWLSLERREFKGPEGYSRYMDTLNDTRQTAAQVLGAVGLGAAAVFSIMNYQLSQDTLELSRKAQSMERFAEAVELLGAVRDSEDSGKEVNLEARAGAAFALAAIARALPENRLTVHRVLSTFVWANSRRNRGEDSIGATPMDVQAGLDGLIDLRVGLAQQLGIVAVIKPSDCYRDTPPEWRLRLDEAHLQGARLSSMDLRWASLRGADLSGAELIESDLSCADLRGATLRDALLYRARVIGADLEGVQFDGAKTREAVLCSNLKGSLGATSHQLQQAAQVLSVGGAGDECSPPPTATDP